MLNNARVGERVGLEGDVYEQVAAACRGARPKIQRWIEEENGEREGMMGRLAWLTFAEEQIDCCCATTSSITRWTGLKHAKLETGQRLRPWWSRTSGVRNSC